jgi:hypothetical protein
MPSKYGGLFAHLKSPQLPQCGVLGAYRRKICMKQVENRGKSGV